MKDRSEQLGLQAGAAAAARDVLPKFPATPLPDQEVHRFQLSRYRAGLA